MPNQSMGWWSSVGYFSFGEEAYGDVKTSGSNVRGRIVRGPIIPVPLVPHAINRVSDKHGFSFNYFVTGEDEKRCFLHSRQYS
jgi:hypothetical protein